MKSRYGNTFSALIESNCVPFQLVIMNYDYSHLILTILRVSEEENSTIAYSGAACNMSSTCYGGVYQGEYTPTEVLSHVIHTDIV